MKSYIRPGRILLAAGIFLTFINSGICQDTHQEDTTINLEISAKQIYINTYFHDVADIPVPTPEDKNKKVKNVILMIGDGMGLAQVYAASIANRGKLNILNLPETGFSITRSSDSEITDSAAGATAIASGIKTYNGAIGVDTTGTPVKTILEIAEQHGLATGLVATCRITHATPAGFISHQLNRNMYEDIAEDFLKTDIDVFIGGGKNNFTKRRDGQNLLDSLSRKGYAIVTDPDSLVFVKKNKIAGLVSEEDQKSFSKGRGEMLENATIASLKSLKEDPDGFFLMVEGSQIDWGCHANDTGYFIEELLDFDRTAGIVLEFAVNNPGTLVIITADHETGGLSLVDSDYRIGKVEGNFSTGDHTGMMVPVFAFGPGSENFEGVYQNTDIFVKMKEVLGF